VNKTTIEWVRNPDGTQGYTWNPITGCLNGCEYCYARKLANGRLKSRYIENKDLAPIEGGASPSWSMFANPFHPRFWPERLLEFSDMAYKAKGVFVCDMSDLFGIGVPEVWTKMVMGQIGRNFLHRFYLLTKQPQNLIKFSPFPDNCWVGVSATDELTFIRATRYLMPTQAEVKYISLEPLLSWSFNSLPDVYQIDGIEYFLQFGGISWVIIGSQTGKAKEINDYAIEHNIDPDRIMPFGNKWTIQPKIEWVREIVEACDKAGIPVFLKDNLRKLFIAPDGEIPKLR